MFRITSLVIALLIILLSSIVSAEQQYLWEMEQEDELSGYSNDNTGAQFSLSNQKVFQGNWAVKVLPNGEAIETKLALNLAGQRLANWSGKEELILHIYLPADNQLNPTGFFLGMADVTGDWNWVDGVFSESEVQAGWNEIGYSLSEKMKQARPDNEYILYFAFIGFDQNKAKVPLTEAFYLDGIKLRAEQAEDIVYIWPMEQQQEIAGFSNDNTGTRFALDNEYVRQGEYSMAVIPNGEAVETKIEIDLVAEKIGLWSGKGEVVINAYFPPENELNPSMYFLGIADVTDGWSWVGGVFAENEVKEGWNQLSYPLPAVMQDLALSHQYKLYLGFAGQDGNEKIPLQETFYLDGIYVREREGLSFKERLAQVQPELQAEVTALLALERDELLNRVSKQTYDYFWLEANPVNGLIKDRSTADSPCSIAAVGFGLTAIPVGIERGWITDQEGFERVLKTLRTFADGGVEGKNGFFYHFVDMESGRRAGGCELSSIDTAILIAGALFVGEYFEGTIVERLANQLYQRVNWQWMMNDDTTLSMGWKPEAGFLSARWNSFNEGLLAYVLAVGSPTYPISANSWDEIYRPVRDNYINLPMEVLFVYQYPHVWIDFRNKEDHYANYWNNSVTATRINHLFAVFNRYKYKSYDLNIWGISASDGPAGYKPYGASAGNHDGTIAPYASIASMPFTPDLSYNALKAMLQKYGALIWGKYGFVSAFNIDQNWFSDQYIGIDQGDILLMIENHRSGLIWEYFMQNEYIQTAMCRLGFVEKAADYAVTPGYLAEFERLRLAPKEKTAVATALTGSIIIDGDLAEWLDKNYAVVDENMNVPGLIKVDQRKQILNSKFYAQWDQQALYLAVDVADEVVVSNITPGDLGSFYRSDSIEFYIKAPQTAAEIMKLAVLPFDTEGNIQAVRHEDSAPGPVSRVAPEIELASERTDRGYRIEVKIPWKYLGVKPEVGLELGFCQTIHNSNQADAAPGEYVRENMLAWNNLPEIWANPDFWGRLVLE